MTESKPIQCAECEVLLADNEQLSKEVNTLRAQLAELREAAESARAFVTWIASQWECYPAHIKEFAHNNADRLRTALADTDTPKED